MTKAQVLMIRLIEAMEDEYRDYCSQVGSLAADYHIWLNVTELAYQLGLGQWVEEHYPDPEVEVTDETPVA